MRVKNVRGSITDLGTGTVLGGRGGIAVVLTVKHLFDEGRGRVEVVFRNRARRSARVVAVSRQADLAALAISDERDLPLLSLAPAQARSATLLGYGSDGILRAKTGVVRDRFGSGDYEYSFLASQGDSGGPALSFSGQLTGICWGKSGGDEGSAPGVTVGVSTLRIFLPLLTARTERPPAVAYGPLPSSQYESADESAPPPPTIAQAASGGHNQEIQPCEQSHSRSAP